MWVRARRSAGNFSTGKTQKPADAMPQLGVYFQVLGAGALEGHGARTGERLSPANVHRHRGASAQAHPPRGLIGV